MHLTSSTVPGVVVWTKTELGKKEEAVQVATLLTIIDEEAQEVFLSGMARKTKQNWSSLKLIVNHEKHTIWVV